MFESKVDKLAQEYMLLSNQDKKFRVNELKRREQRLDSIAWVLFLIVLVAAGLYGWVDFFSSASGGVSGGGKLELACIVSDAALFVEVALAKSRQSDLWYIVLLLTAAIATFATSFICLPLLVWTFFFLDCQMKLAALKMQIGYPLFDTAVKENPYSLTGEQQIAMMRKRWDDMDDPDSARKSDSEKLDKILSGELDLDGFLGIKMPDSQFADAMDAADPSRLANADRSIGSIGSIKGSKSGKNNKSSKNGYVDSAEDFFAAYSSGGNSQEQ